MLQMIIPYYEKHHELKLAEGVIPEAIRLAKRYDKDRRLPDSAIDLVDRTMAAVRMMSQTTTEEIDAFSTGLEQLEKNEAKYNEVDQLKEVKWFYSQLKDK